MISDLKLRPIDKECKPWYKDISFYTSFGMLCYLLFTSFMTGMYLASIFYKDTSKLETCKAYYITIKDTEFEFIQKLVENDPSLLVDHL